MNRYLPTDSSTEAVHAWFSLTRSSYLVLQKAHLAKMPLEWQERLSQVVVEINTKFWFPESISYTVKLIDEEKTVIGKRVKGCIVIPRVLMQKMSAGWQGRFVDLMKQLDYRLEPSESCLEYQILLVEDGEVVEDPLSKYKQSIDLSSYMKSDRTSKSQAN